MSDGVIDLSAARERRAIRFGTTKKSGTRTRCRHWTVLIDTSARDLECEDCGAPVDPFTLLNDMARLNEQADYATRREALLSEQIVSLEKRIKTVRAAIRREIEKAEAAGLVAKPISPWRWDKTIERENTAERIERAEAAAQPGDQPGDRKPAE